MVMRDTRGFWNVLSKLELTETPKIAMMLKPFLQPVTDCYECGVELPTLSCKSEPMDDIRIAGLFLKRLLNDLRATWNLLALGYTAQAGSVAAAAFENALTINCVVGDMRRAEKIKEVGRPPWSVAEMCRIYARKLRQGTSTSQRVHDNDHAESNLWRAVYAHYEWLCNVKHPTVASVLHDAFSVSLTGTDYLIMAAPDTREEDLPNKAFILTVTIIRIIEAMEAIASARQLDYEKPNVTSWKKRFDSIGVNLDKAVDPLMKIPLAFDYKGRIFAKDYRERGRI